MNLQALANLVPPLRGCALCLHSLERDGTLHCVCPAVRVVAGVQPVRLVRQPGEACGPGADHLDMAAWRRA